MDFGPLPTKRDAPFALTAFKSTTNIKLIIPDGYVLATAKVKKESRKSFGFYKIQIDVVGNTIEISRQIEITEAVINAMHYDVLRAFITEWNDGAYKELILKKK